MTRRSGRPGAVLVAVVLAAAVATSLAGCGSTGVDGAASTTIVDPGPTASPTPTTAPTLSRKALGALVARQTTRIVGAARDFHQCDHTVYDGGSSPCRAYVARETKMVDSLLGDLLSVDHPKSYRQTIIDLRLMSKAGAQVARYCAVTNDQQCDQALARFRADEQSVLWDLDARL